jgi:DNA-binding Lrp family transcriptional regulator
MQLAYIALKAKVGKLKLVYAGLEELDEVAEFHEVYGRFDIIALVEVEDMDKLRAFIQNKIMILEGLSSCETLVVRN